MKINLKSVESLVWVDKNTVRGTIDGFSVRHDITIQRKLSGWTPQLSISVDGIVLHDCEANKEEREAFDFIHNKAFEQQIAAEDKRRASVKEQICPIIFVK